MSTHLSDFTRGSQLLGHFAFMFAAGIKWPVLGTLFSVLAVVAWTLFGTLSDHEIDPARAASLCAWLSLAGVRSGEGTERQAAERRDVADDDGAAVVLCAGRARLGQGARRASCRATVAGVLIVPLLALFFWFATMFGDHSKQSRHQRGALLAPLPDLRRQIAAHNRARA